MSNKNLTNKTELMGKFERQLTYAQKDKILKFLFDYFSFNELVKLSEHIEEEGYSDYG